MKAYKAFNKGYVCLGYKYTDKEHKIQGRVEVCRKGFHACLNPHGLENYYSVKDPNTVFAIVDIYGDIDALIYKDKVAAQKIKIIQKFNNIEDLYKEYEKNGNPTEGYIKKLVSEITDSSKHTIPIFRCNGAVLKDILEYDDNDKKTLTDAKALAFILVFGYTHSAEVIRPLDEFPNMLRYITHAYKEGEDSIIGKHMNTYHNDEYLPNKLSIYKGLSPEQTKELKTYINRINERFGIDLIKICKAMYLVKHSHVLHKNQKAERLIIQLPSESEV